MASSQQVNVEIIKDKTPIGYMNVSLEQTIQDVLFNLLKQLNDFQCDIQFIFQMGQVRVEINYLQMTFNQFFMSFKLQKIDDFKILITENKNNQNIGLFLKRQSTIPVDIMLEQNKVGQINVFPFCQTVKEIVIQILNQCKISGSDIFLIPDSMGRIPVDNNNMILTFTQFFDSYKVIKQDVCVIQIIQNRSHLNIGNTILGICNPQPNNTSPNASTRIANSQQLGSINYEYKGQYLYIQNFDQEIIYMNSFHNAYVTLHRDKAKLDFTQIPIPIDAEHQFIPYNSSFRILFLRENQGIVVFWNDKIFSKVVLE